MSRRRWPLARLASRLLVAAGVVLAPGLALAGTPAPLPILELRSLQGEAVSPEGYARSGRWLLVYVTPFSGASRSLLQALGPATEGGGPPITVVVGGTPAEAAGLAKEYEGRFEATWFADPQGAARKALGLQALPVMIGVRGSATQWARAGAASDRTALRSIVASWR